MKPIKNKIFIFVFLLVGLFFVNINRAEAEDNTSLEKDQLTYECIYSDGGLYEYSFNEYTNDWSITRYSYNLKGVDSVESSSTNVIKYANNTSPVVAKDGFYRCQPYVLVAKTFGEENGEVNTFIQFKDSSDNKFSSKAFDEGKKWYYYLFGIVTTTEVLNGDGVQRNSYELVSENYIFTEKAPDPTKIFTYKRENEKAEGEVEQAVSKPDYIRILKYPNESGSYYFIQGNTKTSYYAATYNENLNEIYFNDASPKSYKGTDSKISYYYNAVRYYGQYSNVISENYRRYVRVSNDEGNGNFDTGELCTKIMPNTAKDLAKVIGWIRILVPVFLIVLTGFDFAKIVLSDNLDEEMPKQKKKIIIRFIIVVVFFFLPLIVKVLLNNIKGSVDGTGSGSGSEITTEDKIDSIQYIECIFDMI